jgi:hypothetical protein
MSRTPLNLYICAPGGEVAASIIVLAAPHVQRSYSGGGSVLAPRYIVQSACPQIWMRRIPIGRDIGSRRMGHHRSRIPLESSEMAAGPISTIPVREARLQV